MFNKKKKRSKKRKMTTTTTDISIEFNTLTFLLSYNKKYCNFLSCPALPEFFSSMT